MTFEFFLPFSWLNLFFFTFERKEQIKEKTRLVKIKTKKIWNYRKNNNEY